MRTINLNHDSLCSVLQGFPYLLIEEWLLQTIEKEPDTFGFRLLTDARPHKVWNQTNTYSL